MTSVAPDASGTAHLLGWRIDTDRPDGRVAVTMAVRHEHTNRHGNMHGGLIATVLDTAMGATASFMRGDGGKIPFSTISMTVNFLAPMPLGTITATGRIMGGGFKTVFVEGEAHDQTGRLVAQSPGTFKRAPIG